MTMETKMRFLDPVDPRKVWAVAESLLKVTDEPYQYDYRRRGEQRWPHSRFPDNELANDLWASRPGQSAAAWLEMQYGHEGALMLLEKWETHDRAQVDDEEGIQWVPPAYVEISLDTAYGYQDERGGCGDLHNHVWACLEAFFQIPGRVAWSRGECCWAWHVVPESTLMRTHDAEGLFNGHIPAL